MTIGIIAHYDLNKKTLASTLIGVLNKMTIQTEAYKHGFDDFERGVKLENCPYAKGTSEYIDYYWGWKDAKKFWSNK